MVTNMKKLFASWQSSSVFFFPFSFALKNAFITRNTITPSVFTAETRHPPTRAHAMCTPIPLFIPSLNKLYFITLTCQNSAHLMKKLA